MTNIINLTQHLASVEQVAEGVIDAGVSERLQLRELLTFKEMPKRGEMLQRAGRIADFIRRSDVDLPRLAMIGGAPWFMPTLEKVLRFRGIVPLYAFSRRMSKEVVVGGHIRKTTVFQHEGWLASPDTYDWLYSRIEAGYCPRCGDNNLNSFVEMDVGGFEANLWGHCTMCQYFASPVDGKDPYDQLFV